jgi:branched-chain amino acid aminotransferase
MKKIGMKEFVRLAAKQRGSFHTGYYSMYSSIYGGIVTDPALMLVPVDDHMVHRGDGVFEALKCAGGCVYNMKAHLARLANSAAAIGLPLPKSTREIGRIVVETVRAGKAQESVVRLYVSRGPGSFGVSPTDCPASQLYVIVTKMNPPFMSQHPEGARVGISQIAAKPPFFARVKSCNYLPNVLMKKEAEDAGLDGMVGRLPGGLLGEGPTENMGIVTRSKRLLFPKLDGVLRGTTMMRVLDLAGQLVKEGMLREAAFADIRLADVRQAAEAVLVGTTRDVTLVREFDGRPVGTGKPGPVFRKLSVMLLEDIRTNRKLLTPVWCDD